MGINEHIESLWMLCDLKEGELKQRSLMINEFNRSTFSLPKLSNKTVTFDKYCSKSLLVKRPNKLAVFRGNLIANFPTKAGYTNWAEPTNNYKHVKSLHNCEALAALWISTTHTGLRYSGGKQSLALSNWPVPHSTTLTVSVPFSWSWDANVTWCGDYPRQLLPDGHLCKWDPTGALSSLLNILGSADKLARRRERERELCHLLRMSDRWCGPTLCPTMSFQHFTSITMPFEPEEPGDLLTIH